MAKYQHVTFAEYNKQISILPPDIMSIEQLIEAIQKVREMTAPGEWIQGWGIAWSTQPIFLYSEIESYLVNLGED